jgi:small subunit ribosomal protein S16
LAVVIRLARMGKTHKPFYRITVADSRKAATGKFLEQIGHYDPNLNPPAIKVDEASALKWLKNGAQPSDTVRTLFYRQGLMEKSALGAAGKATAESPLKARESFQAKKPKVHKQAKAKADAKAASDAKAAADKVAADKAAAEAAAAEKAAAAEAVAAEKAAAAEAAAAEKAAAAATPEAPAAE